MGLYRLGIGQILFELLELLEQFLHSWHAGMYWGREPSLVAGAGQPIHPPFVPGCFSNKLLPVSWHMAVVHFWHMDDVHRASSVSVSNCLSPQLLQIASSTGNSCRWSMAVHLPKWHVASSWKGYLSHISWLPQAWGPGKYLCFFHLCLWWPQFIIVLYEAMWFSCVFLFLDGSNCCQQRFILWCQSSACCWGLRSYNCQSVLSPETSSHHRLSPLRVLNSVEKYSVDVRPQHIAVICISQEVLDWQYPFPNILLVYQCSALVQGEIPKHWMWPLS